MVKVSLMLIKNRNVKKEKNRKEKKKKCIS